MGSIIGAVWLAALYAWYMCGYLSLSLSLSVLVFYAGRAHVTRGTGEMLPVAAVEIYQEHRPLLVPRYHLTSSSYPLSGQFVLDQHTVHISPVRLHGSDTFL